jgi:hypothetical protein
MIRFNKEIQGTRESIPISKSILNRIFIILLKKVYDTAQKRQK